MTRILVISDLHLGSRLGRDTLRRPAVLEVLLGALADVDHLVLLGDTVELLEGRGAKAMRVAQPVLETIGGAMRGGLVTVVPGNHDHALVRPWLRERLAADKRIGLASRVPLRSSARLKAIAGWLKPARVEVRYPGVWLGDRIWATHGHYLDRHLLPESGWITRGLFGTIPLAHARADDYETATGASNAALAGLSSVALPRLMGEPLDLAVQASHRAAALTVPVAGRLTRGAFAPLSAGIVGFQFRRAGLPAFAMVAERLNVPADHVVFGHVHRAGPRRGDTPAEWSPGRHSLYNTGSWVYEPLLLAGTRPPHPYWPGSGVVIEDGEAPEPVSFLGDLRLQ